MTSPRCGFFSAPEPDAAPDAAHIVGDKLDKQQTQPQLDLNSTSTRPQLDLNSTST